MSLINEDLKLKILKGNPILLQKTNAFFIHRTINEVIDFTYSEFLKIITLFNMSNEEIQKESGIPMMTTFMYLLIIYSSNNYSSLIDSALKFFINAENVVSDMENKQFIFSCGNVTDIVLNEEGFKEILEYINIIYNGTFLEKEQDLSDAERRMKEKFDRKRREREAAKRNSGTGNVGFSDMIGGFAVRNYNFDFKRVLELPYYTFFFLLRKLRKYDDYELQLKARLAGADIKEDLQYWISGDEDENDK